MRKNFKIICLLMAAVMLLVSYLPAIAADKSDFFITEVCYNGNTSSDIYEYIELVNISDKVIDIRNYTVTNQNNGGTVKSNSLYTAATGNVQPGQIVVIVIYQSSTAEEGVGYNTAEEIDSMRVAFNNAYSSDVSAESFYVAPKVPSGGGSTISGAFNLSNSAEEVVVQLVNEAGNAVAGATYNAAKYNRNKYSVGFGLSETSGPRCMGITACTPGIAYEELYSPATGDFTENVKVMTYNICASGVDSDPVGVIEGADCVPLESLYIDNRQDEVLGLVTQEDADLVCLNEVNGEWWYYIESILCGDDDKYGYVSNTGNGHKLSASLTNKWDTAPLLLYDKVKYELIEEGYFFCPADSRGIHTVNNWATLRNKTTGAEFMFMTQHFSASSDDVRVASADLVVNKISEIAGNLPVIVMGDYNCAEGSTPYNTFINNGFNDSSRINPDTTFRYSFGGWYIEEDLTPTRDMNIYLPIDLIMLSEGDFDVASYKVVEDRFEDNQYGYSDHFPVVAELKMRNIAEEVFRIQAKSKHSITDGYFYCEGNQLTAEEVLNDAFFNSDAYGCDTGKYVGTGSKIYLKSDENQYLTVVLKGDIDGDGKITTTDYIKVRRKFAGSLTIEGIFLDAADVNSDGKISTLDYLLIKKHVGGKANIYEAY